jgi:hypothetical protein
MPKDPPRDAAGLVVPHDHAEILDDHHVIRHTVQNDLARDENGQFRVSSGAYSESSDPEGGMSVDIWEWMSDDGLSPLHYLRDDLHGAVRIKVGDLRRLGLLVGWLPMERNPHHGCVWGLTKSLRRKVSALPKETLRKVSGEN